MGSEELDEPLVVRPTSETIIWQTFAKWVQSYRDLPLLINQWANVVRWEMRPRLFLRTTEFLWQEGHTAHATKDEAKAEAKQMLEAYRQFAEDVMAMPVHRRPEDDGRAVPRRRGDAQDRGDDAGRKALQAGTSHYLGQNFAKAYDMQFQDASGESALRLGHLAGACRRGSSAAS